MSFKKNNLLVTGAGGSIGSEIARQLTEKYKGIEIILNDISEPSLFKINEELKHNANNNKIIPILGDVKTDFFENQIKGVGCPKKIYHAAAYKHVNLSQTNELSYFMNNVYSTKKILDFSEKYESQIILISTDKAVFPINVMGKTKRVCEILLLNKNLRKKTSHKIVRFGNVLNSSGSVIPLFKDQINKGGPVLITDKNATRFFMTIQEAVNLVLSAEETKKTENILVLEMGMPVSIDSLAKNMIAESGLRIVEKKNNKKEIELRYIGLRDGEKLNEKLSYGKTHLTQVKNILVADEKSDFSNETIEEISSALRDQRVPLWEKIKWHSQ